MRYGAKTLNAAAPLTAVEAMAGTARLSVNPFRAVL
jgi:hypothetical protein